MTNIIVNSMKTSLLIIKWITYSFIGLLLFVTCWGLISNRYQLPIALQFFAVQSGSMEPAIKTGSLVITLSQDNYYAGSIITYYSKPLGKTVTHRISSTKLIGAETRYITKGDANNSPDPVAITNSSILGKVVFVIPYLGFPALFTKSITGLILFVIIPATVIVYHEILSLGESIKKAFRKTKKRSKFTFIYRNYIYS